MQEVEAAIKHVHGRDLCSLGIQKKEKKAGNLFMSYLGVFAQSDLQGDAFPPYPASFLKTQCLIQKYVLIFKKLSGIDL